MKSPFKRTRCFCRDEDGAQTIEAVIWLPVFVMFIVLIIDVSSVFNRQSEMLRIVQDANRSFATGRLSSSDAAEAFVQTALGSLAASTTVTTTLIDGIISTRLTIPATALMPINSIPIFRDKDVVVANQQLAEF
ncbi:TadE/TadG family type IV pilus assembly protein [Thalassococcus sp. BH17M4-6]|uniref:TadE/TadG family type IV pilus assembly protein n=1 Tax=Thalassococcus sp. BH17M4-6 TaxID=3413148 RepID=UPI003BE27C1F